MGSLLQSLSLPAAAMTLRDQACQAVSNGSHFLLALPVIFCGTEGELQKEPRGVLYKNMVRISNTALNMKRNTFIDICYPRSFYLVTKCKTLFFI